MKKFNYYYFGTSITRNEFEKNVPENWKDQLDEYGEFSYGGYKAILRDEN